MKEVESSVQDTEKLSCKEDTKVTESKNKERLKMVTIDPFLLLSFVFFDRSQCGYILNKDLETLILSLGLNLSRHQVNNEYSVLIFSIKTIVLHSDVNTIIILVG